MSAKSDFVAQMYRAGLAAGLTDAAARVMAGQAAIESAYGTRAPGNNFFAITKGKDWTGPTITRTDKDASGNPIKQQFRVYDSPEAGIADRIQFMQDKFPDFSQAPTMDAALTALQNGKLGAYYTAPRDKYESTVKGIDKKYLASTASADHPIPPADIPNSAGYLAGKQYGKPGGGVGVNADKLDPEFARRLTGLMQAAEKATGVPVSVFEGYRDPKRQAQLYANYKGKDVAYEGVTYSPNGTGYKAAPPGASEHQLGMAVDIRTGPEPDKEPAGPAFEYMREHAAEYGLHWFGSSDPAHFEIPRTEYQAALSGKAIAPFELPGVPQTAVAAIDSAFPMPMPAAIASAYAEPEIAAGPRASVPTVAAIPSFMQPTDPIQTAALPEPAPAAAPTQPAPDLIETLKARAEAAPKPLPAPMRYPTPVLDYGMKEPVVTMGARRAADAASEASVAARGPGFHLLPTKEQAANGIISSMSDPALFAKIKDMLRTGDPSMPPLPDGVTYDPETASFHVTQEFRDAQMEMVPESFRSVVDNLANTLMEPKRKPDTWLPASDRPPPSPSEPSPQSAPQQFQPGMLGRGLPQDDLVEVLRTRAEAKQIVPALNRTADQIGQEADNARLSGYRSVQESGPAALIDAVRPKAKINVSGSPDDRGVAVTAPPKTLSPYPYGTDLNPGSGRVQAAPSTTYKVVDMEVSNPDYVKYINAQKADAVGLGPGSFGDLQAMIAGSPTVAPAKTITVQKRVPVVAPTPMPGRPAGIDAAVAPDFVQQMFLGTPIGKALNALNGGTLGTYRVPRVSQEVHQRLMAQQSPGSRGQDALRASGMLDQFRMIT